VALLPRVVYRCSRGHLFTVGWSPGENIAAIRLGFARFQRCPVGKHWGWVRVVDKADLTEQERQTIEERDAARR
jgi:hypothetical protein